MCNQALTVLCAELYKKIRGHTRQEPALAAKYGTFACGLLCIGRIYLVGSSSLWLEWDLGLTLHRLLK